METEIADALDEFVESTGIPKTRVVEKAVEEYLGKRTKVVNGEKRYMVETK